jgi:hypothetical protein
MKASLAQNESHSGFAGQHTRASTLAHARSLVCEVVRDAPDASLKGKLASAAEILQLTLWRVLRYRTGKVRIIEAYEYANILELAQANRVAILQRRAAEMARRVRELAEADARLGALAPTGSGDRELPAPSSASGALRTDADHGGRLGAGLSG